MRSALDPLLEQLHLENARRRWSDLCERAERESWSYETLLHTLLAEELAHRSRTHLADQKTGRTERTAERRASESLSERERDVLRIALLGLHTKAIAYELRIAASTVRVLLRRAAIKLGARSRGELLAKGASLGLM